MAHYECGPKLNKMYKCNVCTFGDFVRTCERITSELGEGYLCVPEKIHEGGILFKKYPNKKNKFEYKSLRVRWMNYPFIKDTYDTLDAHTLRVEHSCIFLDTTLKAFHGAPRFTNHELTVIMNQLALMYTTDTSRPNISRILCDRTLEKTYIGQSSYRLRYNKFNDELNLKRRQFAIGRIKRNEITNSWFLKLYTKRLFSE